jgi:Tat protein secretion system quality control protein TatD with DNase activity
VLVDSHVHLDRYPPPEQAAMLARARAAGVERFLAIGVDLASSTAAVQLTTEHAGG